ncbi:glycosyltransferase [Opitutus terrae]|uniref:glycosyltransferase n=1 Tax=Opitutus terrae TaxID=107709 RepID=UPI0002DA3FC3|nr:glycosyltransferase [Opitutus terrae]
MNPDFLGRTAVLIPALNEAPCIADTVHYWQKWGAALVRVVDNGSTDATAARAREAGAEVRTEPRRGYGAAAWTGSRDLPATIEWILFSSADGSDRIEGAAAAFQTEIDSGAALVLGERVTRPDSRRRLTPMQRFGNALGCALIALGWGRRFRDLASLRVIRRDAFERLALRDRGFGWNVEMQVRALEHGLRIAEVPVHFHPRAAGESKISGNLAGVWRAGWGILTTVAKLRFARGGVETGRSSAACCTSRWRSTG